MKTSNGILSKPSFKDLRPTTSKPPHVCLPTILLSFMLSLPTPALADPFVFDISPDVDWIKTSAIQLNHDAAGNYHFALNHNSRWTTAYLKSFTELKGDIRYANKPDGINAKTLTDKRDLLDFFSLFNPSTVGVGEFSYEVSDLSATRFQLTAMEHRTHDNGRNGMQGGGGRGTHISAPSTTPIPEPSTILLLSTGLLGLAGYRWSQRRRERAQPS